MKRDDTDFYAALIHELKNNLGLLAMTIEQIPIQNEPVHDQSVDAARLLCQGVIGRLQQALFIYKVDHQQMHPAINAYSPHDLIHEISDQATALSRGHLRIEAEIQPEVPAIWFLDRDLIEMALINAIHNSLAYARSTIRIEATMLDECLALTVRDDSDGYPEHVLTSVATNTPYRSTGTGLGLQFARLIAQSHDNQGRTGELRLHNDQGAVFSLILP
jgi:K+-sensing histidine kinase KdpD